MKAAPQSALLARLEHLLGAGGVLTAESDTAPLLTDQRELYRGKAVAVALPDTAPRVAAVLALCNETGVAVVPQGGNTGYCGGATPDESGAQLLVSLRRLNRIRAVDALNYSLVAEAGCVLADVQRAAEEADRFFPLSLGSEGTCQIGGNLSTNAGGLHVLRYGMMRDLVLGLEVALADGRLLSALTTLRKDNTGYDIKSLFLGAEGTLGIITAASLKLYPRMSAAATAFAAIRDPRAAVQLLARLREASGERVSAFELIPRLAVELTTRHIPGVRDPLDAPHAWYVLCELTSARPDRLDTILTESLEQALGAGLVADAALARNEGERAGFWKLRETIPEAQRRDGASLKHDVAVPVAAIAQFIERAGEWVRANVPDGRLIAYGHVGDGNLHFNLNQAPGADRAAFLARGEAIKRVIHDMVVREFGGSFSAEHGIGRLKVGELERYAPPVELDLMRAIKRAFDPNGILNPGKVLR
jgi:D-lactate dehydrogenase (cytochrome)